MKLSQAVVDLVARWNVPGKELSPRTRAEMTDDEVRAALKSIEAGDPRVRAILEMAIDRASAITSSALAPKLEDRERAWTAGAAYALTVLVQEILSGSIKKEDK